MKAARNILADTFHGAVGGLLRTKPLPPDVEALARLRRGVDVVDLRGVPQSARAKRARRKGTIKKVEGATVHQTAGPVNNWENVPCHIGIGRDGTVYLVHPIADKPAYLHAAHALNRRSVSIEVECRAAGIEGVERSFWRRASEKEHGKTMADLADEADAIQLFALTLTLGYLAAFAGPLKLWTHRQGHESRVSDPGSKIALHMEYVATHHHRLMMAPTDAFGSGRPNARQWSRDGIGGPYAWWDRP